MRPRHWKTIPTIERVFYHADEEAWENELHAYVSGNTGEECYALSEQETMGHNLGQNYAHLRRRQGLTLTDLH